jgi:ketosteroid isomerase-like protein
MSTIEEQRVRSYVECFNRHDLAGVMDCFDDHPVVVDMLGKRHEGRDEIRRFYELQFAMFPDARCDIKVVAGRASTGMAETDFHGTYAKTGKVVTAFGPEIVEFAGNKIKELRDYHRLTSS